MITNTNSKVDNKFNIGNINNNNNCIHDIWQICIMYICVYPYIAHRQDFECFQVSAGFRVRRVSARVRMRPRNQISDPAGAGFGCGPGFGPMQATLYFIHIYIYCWCRELGSFKDCAFFFVSFCAGRVSEMGVRTFLFYRYWQIWRKHVARKLRVSQNLDKSTICHVFLKSTFQVFYISSCHRLSWFQTKPSTLYQNITHYNTLRRFRGEEM